VLPRISGWAASLGLGRQGPLFLLLSALKRRR
jgi:hypothetical protein